MNGDLRMMKLWARLKAGALEEEGRQAAAQVGDEKTLASARMRVRSVQPYLDEAQRDVFAGKWKFVQGYLGVVFSQRDAFQTIVTDTYPGNDPVSLASKDALISEGNNIIKNAELLAAAAKAKSEPQAIQAYAKLSLSYDRFLKAGDLYGNSKLLPTGTRPKPRAKVNPPSGPAVISVQQQATAQAAKLDAAESVTDQAAAEVAAKQAAAKAAAKAAAVATEVADKAEAASEKADAAERAATKAAAEKQAAAKAAAEAAEKTELEAEAREVQAAQEAAEKKKAVEAATARLKAAEAKEVEQEATVRLYEKALDFEKKQDEAARKLASQADMTAGLVPQYDPITSTESLYKDTPQSALQYSTVKPKVKDAIVVIAGPDKGRVGVLLGIDGDTSIVKLSTRELKVIDVAKVAKQQ